MSLPLESLLHYEACQSSSVTDQDGWQSFSTQYALISAVPLLPWVIHKRTAIEILHNAMVPEASDDLAFTDLVRLAGP